MTPEQRREAGRKGGKARAALPDFREHQRRAGKRSAEVNDMAALGHKGAVAYARKYGYAGLFRLCREWRLAHPSVHEREVIAVLESLGATDYEREALPLGEAAFVSVDFCFWARQKVIEVNGKVHHDPLFDHPNAPGTRAENERRRLAKLEKAGWQVLVLDYRDLAAARERIAEFLRAT